MKTINISIQKRTDSDQMMLRIEVSDTEGQDLIDSLIQLKADKISVFIDGKLPNALDQNAPATVWQDGVANSNPSSSCHK